VAQLARVSRGEPGARGYFWIFQGTSECLVPEGSFQSEEKNSD
jgi:hypothetical protein